MIASMEEKRKPLPWYWWMVAGLIVIAGYVLSLGPVALLMKTFGLRFHPWAAPAAGVVYWPLKQLTEVSPTFEHALLAYVEMWVDIP